jgi:hypothetical protein
LWRRNGEERHRIATARDFSSLALSLLGTTAEPHVDPRLGPIAILTARSVDVSWHAAGSVERASRRSAIEGSTDIWHGFLAAVTIPKSFV